jgi:malonyl-CoA decarboxylase
LNWLEKVIDNVAERGLELLGIKSGDSQNTDLELCQTLLARQGEASNIALANEILQRYAGKTEEEKTGFFIMLVEYFSPDIEAISQAVSEYQPGDPHSLQRLIDVVEPPRQELFRRLNMAPQGISRLLMMRGDLLARLRVEPSLQSVDADMRHLFSSWFNRGFLTLQRIDWSSPATVLERLIQHESVHPMQGWDDLHRRLGRDRMCFAFFHPALPHIPLIFVEVALTQGMPDSIAPLIDPHAEELDPTMADTAVFYSINNSLSGLRGISFGNFLIKQVVAELQAEHKNLKTFTTLSPVPLFRKTIESLASNDTQDTLISLLGKNDAAVLQTAGPDNFADVLGTLALDDTSGAEQRDEMMRILTLYYLTCMHREGRIIDPVAYFHLSNGAILERINVGANTADKGLQESYGCMINYLYEPDNVIANHEAFTNDQTIAMSRQLRKIYDSMISRLH